MIKPNIAWMYQWLNNFFPGINGESQDYLQIGRASDGTIVGWIDEEGHLQGSLAYGIPQVQTQRIKYTLTVTDIKNGFAPVPVTWGTPFTDTNYTVAFSINDLDSTIDLSLGTLDMHDKTAAGITVVAFIAAAVPLVQGQVDLVDSTSGLTPLSLTAPITTLYQITFYYGPATDSGSGTWIPSVTWTDPNNNDLTLTYPYLGAATAGDVENYQSYSIPFFVLADTPIVVTGAYSGTAFPMNISIRVVQMPNNAVLVEPGDQFIVNAIAVHDASPCNC